MTKLVTVSHLCNLMKYFINRNKSVPILFINEKQDSLIQFTSGSFGPLNSFQECTVWRVSCYHYECSNQHKTGSLNTMKHGEMCLQSTKPKCVLILNVYLGQEMTFLYGGL
jgi:hypothetical protein